MRQSRFNACMHGIFFKTLRETWVTTLAFGLGLALIMGLLTWALPRVQPGLADMFMRMPFVRNLLAAQLGIDPNIDFTQSVMRAFIWVHPVALTVMFVHATILSTRFPASEIDRGTVEVLLALPVSRRQIFLTESCVIIASGVILSVGGTLSHLLLRWLMGVEITPDAGPLFFSWLSLLCLYASVAGVGLLLSSVSNKRGKAMTAIFVVLIFSYLLNVIAQIWEPARPFRFLSVLNYYQPAMVFLNRQFPIGDVLVLSGIAVTTWFIGSEITARRSITVQ